MRKTCKPEPIRIRSVNREKGNPLNPLEASLLGFQKMIRDRRKEGKKGIVLFKGEDSEYRLSYKELQGVLWEVHTYFAMKGAFSFGICGNCENFDNSCSQDGTFGYCKGREHYMVDSCSNFKGVGGFGSERD